MASDTFVQFRAVSPDIVFWLCAAPVYINSIALLIISHCNQALNIHRALYDKRIYFSISSKFAPIYIPVSPFIELTKKTLSLNPDNFSLDYIPCPYILQARCKTVNQEWYNRELLSLLYIKSQKYT